MDNHSDEEKLFGECLDSFVKIVANRRSKNHAGNWARKEREEPWDPALMDELFGDRDYDGCEKHLKAMEEERLAVNPVINVESINLFIDSDVLLRILERLPEKLLQSIVMGVGFDYDNDLLAEKFHVKPNTAKVYKSKAIRAAAEGIRSDEEDG